MNLLTIQTSEKNQVVDITDEVNNHLHSVEAKNGLCHLMALHTTVALSTADMDPGGTDLDYLEAFRQMMPQLKYRHYHDPSHMPDHILASLIGTSLTLPVDKGALVLGHWQKVVFFEFNGPQERKLVINYQSL